MGGALSDVQQYFSKSDGVLCCATRAAPPPPSLNLPFLPSSSPVLPLDAREIEERIDSFAAGLEYEGLMPPNPDGMTLLAIYARNRPEWIISEQVCFLRYRR